MPSDFAIPCFVEDPRLAVLAPLPPLAAGGQGLLWAPGGLPEARLVYWLWEDGTALIGALEARSEEAGTALLTSVREMLARAHCERIVGPMNGSTWFEYRLPLPRDGAGDPFFSGEPAERPELVRCFREAGFTLVEEYESRVVDLPAGRSNAAGLADRLRRGRIAVSLPQGEPSALLRRLFDFSTQAFAGNRFFRPVSFAEFAAAQGGRETGPPLVLLAERGEELLGFAYAYPDGVDPSRLVLKTLATSPAARALGLGAHLADRVHDLAARHGFRQVIHALMHVENASLRHSHRFGSRLLRRYGLFGWSPE